MSTTVDSRVVEMRFDNKQFEKGAKETMSTLQRLKAALNFSNSAKDLEKINTVVKKTSMDSLLESVQALEKRFSAMGIVGMQTITNITNAMTNKLGGAVGWVINTIDTAGKRRAMNIENAHFQLQALLKDEELVQKIMNQANESVSGTAYAYDEAAKAASMFAASGVQAGEQMQQSLNALVGVAAMTNSEYEGIAQIFTTVAGNGRLMGDQLLQLSSRGLNAAATLKDYFNGVNSGSIQATDSMKALIAEISGGVAVTEGDIREMVSDSLISFDIFSAAMNDAFGESAKRANETFNGAFSNMKSALGRIGAEFYSPLIAQNSNVVLLLNALKDRINDVKKGLTFDKEINNTNALSKQFTDTVLKMAAATTEFVKKVDLETPLSIFYHGLESMKNMGKAFMLVLQPMAEAFEFVFGKNKHLKLQTLDEIAAKLENFTAKITMSNQTSKNLKTTFTGLFNVAELLRMIFVDLLKALNPIGRTLGVTGASITDMTAAIGKLLTKFSIWVKSSPGYAKTFEVIGQLVDGMVIGVGLLIQVILELIKNFKQMPVVEKAMEKITQLFEFIGTKASKYLKTNNKDMKTFAKNLRALVPEVIASGFAKLNGALEKFGNLLKRIDMTYMKDAFENLRTTMGDIYDIFRKSDGVVVFTTNLKKYFGDLESAFTVTNLLKTLDMFKEKVGGFITWLKNTFTPMIQQLDAGTIIAGGTSVGMIAGLYKLTDAFDKIAGTIKKFGAIPEFFNTMKGVMKAYQQDLQAEAILKVAAAIAVLGGALTVMSFADPQRLSQAALALSVLAGILMTGVVKFTEASHQTATMADAATVTAMGVKKALSNLAKALKWKEISSALKSFAFAMGVIIVGLIALAYTFKNNQEGLTNAVPIIYSVGAALVGVVAAMAIIGEIFGSGLKNVGSGALGIASFALMLGVAIGALVKLMQMELPKDWKVKCGILAGIFAALGGVMIAMAAAQAIAGKHNLVSGDTSVSSQGGKVQSGPIVALTAMLVATVSALDKLFKMKLPNDYGVKLAILAGIFVGLAGILVTVGVAAKIAGEGKIQSAPLLAVAAVLTATVSALGKLFEMTLPSDWGIKVAILAGMFVALAGVIVAIGYAAKLSEGGLKAGPTILAIATFIGAVTTSLMVLQMIPFDKLLPAAAALGVLLVALGAALYGAGNIKDDGASKAIKQMVLLVGAITSGLSILALIPFDKLAKATAAMGAMLLALAVDFASIGKITNEKSYISVLGMVGMVVTITASLKILASEDWQTLLAAGTAMTGVLLALALCFKVISGATVDLAKVGMFLLATTSTVLIAISLVAVASQPWQGILAAGTALSATLLAFSVCFAIISSTTVNPIGIAAFLAGCAGIILIAVSISMLAKYDWKSLLAAGTAISEVMLAMTVCMAVCALVGAAAPAAIAGMATLDLFLVNLTAIIAAFGALAQSDTVVKLIDSGIDILVKMADGIARIIDAVVGGTMEKLSARLPNIGKNISRFMINLQPFLIGAHQITPEITNGVMNLAKAMLALTAADLVDGIVSFFKGGRSTMSEFGKELAKLGPYLSQFAASIAGIDAKQVEAAASAAELMSQVASRLPRNNDLVNKIFGEKKTLAEFGKELALFGPSLQLFATSVKDVTPDKVEAAASAAEILAKMAKKLPNTGGLVAKIFGDKKSLSDFGDELVKFGPSIAQFAEQVKDIKPEAVEGAASATEMLAKMAKTLPNSGGLVAWFAGDNDLGDFSKGLEALGQALLAFYTNVENVDVEVLNQSVDELNHIVQIAKGMIDLDTSGMTNFASSLEIMGANGIEAFVRGFENSMDRVQAAVNTMLGYVTRALEKGQTQSASAAIAIGAGIASAISLGIRMRQSDTLAQTQALVDALVNKVRGTLTPALFTNIGTLAMMGLNTGIQSKSSLVTNTSTTVATKTLTTFKINLSSTKLRAVAESAMNALASGISGRSYHVNSAAIQLCNTVIQTFQRNINSNTLRGVGQNAAMGLAYGIQDKIYAIANAAIRAAVAAVEAAKKALDEHSPSKVFYGIGENVDKGFANGILAFTGLVSNASEHMAEDAITSTTDAMSGLTSLADSIDLSNINPVITPSMDFTQLQEDYDTLNAMMNRSIATTYQTASGINAGFMGSAQRQRSMEELTLQGISASINGLNRPNDMTQTNTFNIYGNDPQSIAQEVSYILQKQVERKEAAWGM